MQSYKEIWKDIPNYEGMYQVSNLGRVKSLKFGKERILKGSSAREYRLISLCKDQSTKLRYVHRIVMLAFVGKSDLEVNHKNGIKTDNRLENLEYCTRSENIKHAFDTGLIPKGEDRSQSKLTRAKAKKIKYEYKGWKLKDIAVIYKITPQMVGEIRSGKKWKYI